MTAATTTFDVKEGSNAVLTITPVQGNELTTLTVNGEDALAQVSNGTMTLSDVRANITVVATFALEQKDEITIKMSVPNGDRTAIGYSSPYGLDFTNVSGVKAWIVNGFTEDADVLLSRVKVVPPNTGLYLTSDVAGVEVNVPTTDKDIWYANLLLAAVEEEMIQPTEMIDGVEYTSFVVGKLKSGVMGFVRVTQPRTLGPNKSRLLVPSSYYTIPAQSRGGLKVSYIDEQTTDVEGTGVDEIGKTQSLKGEYYDLQCRRVSRPAKGLYIREGKKIYVR